MSVQVFRDNTVFVNEVFANGRRLSSVFSHALVQVPESIAYITCIAQVTLKFINYTLLVNNRRLISCTFSSRWILSLTKTGWMTVWVFRLRSFSCLRTMSAESWSLKGRTIRTVGFSFGAGIGCGSSTLEAINDLTVEFIRCCGYFSREKTAIRRSHSSEKYGQHDDKRYALFKQNYLRDIAFVIM